MTPSEVKMISFFFNCLPKHPADRTIISKLSKNEVTYELSDSEKRSLFAIYDDTAFDTQDLEVPRILIDTINKIAGIRVSFIDSQGAQLFATTAFSEQILNELP